jgi:hypothetical protein
VNTRTCGCRVPGSPEPVDDAWSSAAQMLPASTWPLRPREADGDGLRPFRLRARSPVTARSRQDGGTMTRELGTTK